MISRKFDLYQTPAITVFLFNECAYNEYETIFAYARFLAEWSFTLSVVKENENVEKGSLKWNNLERGNKFWIMWNRPCSQGRLKPWLLI